MLAEFGRLSLAEVLAPSIDMADGYPIEAQSAWGIERNKAHIKKWRTSKKLFLPHLGEDWEAPHAGEIFRQPALAATLRKLVDLVGAEARPVVLVRDDDGRLHIAERLGLDERLGVLAQVDHLIVDPLRTGGPAYRNGLNRDSVYSSRAQQRPARGSAVGRAGTRGFCAGLWEPGIESRRE